MAAKPKPLFFCICFTLLATVTCAGQAKCVDTSVRVVFKTLQPLNFYNSFVTKADDGNLITASSLGTPGEPYQTWGVIFKCTLQGDTIWSRKLTAADGFNTYLYRCLQLANGDILAVGSALDRSNVYGEQDLLLLKLSADGNLLWEKTFNSSALNLNSKSNNIFVYDCKQDAAGGIYMCGQVQNITALSVALIFKINTDGIILWSKGFDVESAPYFAGLAIQNGKITVMGSCLKAWNATPSPGFVMDAAAGDTVLSKAWGAGIYWGQVINNSYAFDGFETAGLTALDNGNIALYGRGNFDGLANGSGLSYVHSAIAEFTPALDFVRGWLLVSPDYSSGSSQVTVFNDGSAAYAWSANIQTNSSSAIFGDFSNGQIVKERVIPYSNSGLSQFGGFQYFARLDAGSQLFANLQRDAGSVQSGIDLLTLHNSDTSGSCMGLFKSNTSVKPMPLEQVDVTIKSISSNVLTESQFPFTGLAGNPFYKQTTCTAISYCDSFTLKTTVDTVCANTQLAIHVGKNKYCGAWPYLTYDTAGVQYAKMVNDTTIGMLFNTAWQGYIKGSIPGCSALQDSVKITVLSSPPAVNLGPDVFVCPGDTVTLHAGSGYTFYRWQDGSADSDYHAYKTGQYYVATINACGAVFSDTILVLPQKLPPFSKSGGITLCAGDVATVKAPPGFAQYNWAPNYNISADTGQTVKLYPAVTTLYKITATLLPGCTATDSLLVTVNSAPPVHLGNDTSFCAGQFVTLDAGSAYTSYKWSTGAGTQTIVVDNVGVYSVKAVANGCPAYDTISILNVYAQPKFTLGNDTVLCTGQQLVLAPVLNTPVTYLWQDGSTGPTLNVTTAGFYSLKTTGLCGSYTASVKVTLSPCNILMPSAFTPNGDGFNDIFRLKYPFPVKNFSMVVFNRWGKKIYESNNISDAWDGTCNGSYQPRGAYIWIISLTDAQGKHQEAHGTVILMR